MQQDHQSIELEELVQDMLQHAKDTVVMSHRFMNRASALLKPEFEQEGQGCHTDGKTAWFSFPFVIQAFQADPNELARAYLHMMLHCLLGHPFVVRDADALAWTVAADIAVEAVIEDLVSAGAPWSSRLDDERIRELIFKAGEPTAAALYRVLQDEQPSDEELIALELAVGTDDHDGWFANGEDPNDTESGDASMGPPEESAQVPIQMSETSEAFEDMWKQTARATEMDMAAAGYPAANALAHALGAYPASSLSLAELMRELLVVREAPSADPDEFDLAFYAYALANLGRMALVEPLERVEVPTVHDLFIAIDTSGSVSGRLVRQFVELACGMLLDSVSSVGECRVHVIQCDSEIRDHAILRSRDDVHAYCDDLVIKGHGGTDLRPVFGLVDDALDSGEVEDVLGLIYFTDGEGPTPDKAPTYDAAFAFVDSLGNAPAWATKVLVESGELMEAEPVEERS